MSEQGCEFCHSRGCEACYGVEKGSSTLSVSSEESLSSENEEYYPTQTVQHNSWNKFPNNFHNSPNFEHSNNLTPGFCGYCFGAGCPECLINMADDINPQQTDAKIENDLVCDWCGGEGCEECILTAQNTSLPLENSIQLIPHNTFGIDSSVSFEPFFPNFLLQKAQVVVREDNIIEYLQYKIRKIATNLFISFDEAEILYRHYNYDSKELINQWYLYGRDKIREKCGVLAFSHSVSHFLGSDQAKSADNTVKDNLLDEMPPEELAMMYKNDSQLLLGDLLKNNEIGKNCPKINPNLDQFQYLSLLSPQHTIYTTDYSTHFPYPISQSTLDAYFDSGKTQPIDHCHTCLVCSDEFPLASVHILPCQHIICTDCCKGYIENAVIVEGISSIRLTCPGIELKNTNRPFDNDNTLKCRYLFPYTFIMNFLHQIQIESINSSTHPSPPTTHLNPSHLIPLSHPPTQPPSNHNDTYLLFNSISYQTSLTRINHQLTLYTRFRSWIVHDFIQQSKGLFLHCPSTKGCQFILYNSLSPFSEPLPSAYRCNPEPNEGKTFPSPLPSSLLPPNAAGSQFVCPCGVIFCVSCSFIGSHYPLSCEAHSNYLSSSSTESQSERLIRSTTKQCPQCKVLITKDKNCNHVVCTKCTAEFCWLCKGSWLSHIKDPYSCAKFKPGGDGSGGGGGGDNNFNGEQNELIVATNEAHKLLVYSSFLQLYNYLKYEVLTFWWQLFYLSPVDGPIHEVIQTNPNLKTTLRLLYFYLNSVQWSYIVLYYTKNDTSTLLFRQSQATAVSFVTLFMNYFRRIIDYNDNLSSFQHPIEQQHFNQLRIKVSNQIDGMGKLLYPNGWGKLGGNLENNFATMDRIFFEFKQEEGRNVKNGYHKFQNNTTLPNQSKFQSPKHDDYDIMPNRTQNNTVYSSIEDQNAQNDQNNNLHDPHDEKNNSISNLLTFFTSSSESLIPLLESLSLDPKLTNQDDTLDVTKGPYDGLSWCCPSCNCLHLSHRSDVLFDHDLISASIGMNSIAKFNKNNTHIDDLIKHLHLIDITNNANDSKKLKWGHFEVEKEKLRKEFALNSHQYTKELCRYKQRALYWKYCRDIEIVVKKDGLNDPTPSPKSQTSQTSQTSQNDTNKSDQMLPSCAYRGLFYNFDSFIVCANCKACLSHNETDCRICFPLRG